MCLKIHEVDNIIPSKQKKSLSSCGKPRKSQLDTKILSPDNSNQSETVNFALHIWLEISSGEWKLGGSSRKWISTLVK